MLHYHYIYCCIRQDGTRFDIQCAFNYSDNLVIINQVTPVTIQNKNYLEIIHIRTQIKLVKWQRNINVIHLIQFSTRNA